MDVGCIATWLTINAYLETTGSYSEPENLKAYSALTGIKVVKNGIELCN
jgi:hypothetical protein